MRFLNRSEVRPWFEGRRVAIVGSGPGCDENSEGWVDSHEVVVRVNNFKTTARTGRRTDVFYSFFGTSIRKTSEELIRGGVKLCMSKVPNAHAIESEWHRRHGKMIGVDYRPHYERRKDWWFCDTYVPTVEEFLQPFNALERHQPTSGFAAIWDVLSFDPASVFLTGFDFFRSGIHNVNEPWMVKNTDDPIRHEPELERRWVAAAVNRYSIRCDKRLADAIA
jgi:hypothetical protein